MCIRDRTASAPDGTIVPSGALAVGAPAVIKHDRAKTDYITVAAQSYVDKAKRFKAAMRRID